MKRFIYKPSLRLKSVFSLCQPKRLFLIIFLSALQVQAQTPIASDSVSDSLYTRKQREAKKDQINKRWVFAGNMSFQPKPLFINASPLIGYRFTNNLTMGLGPSYMYNKAGLVSMGSPSIPTSSTSKTTDKGSHVYGGRVFLARRLYKRLFLQGESEALNYPYLQNRAGGKQTIREWVINPLAGLSYNLALRHKSFFQLTVLYNFNYYNNSFNRQLYNSPWIFRLGAGLANSKK